MTTDTIVRAEVKKIAISRIDLQMKIASWSEELLHTEANEANRLASGILPGVEEWLEKRQGLLFK